MAWGDADRRQPDAGGKLPAVGDTVDIARATWTNTIGDSDLVAVWTDPEFDPAQSAFYYVRVLQIPTARHSLLDKLALGDEDIDTRRPDTIQERAYTSPIWYRP